MALTFALSSIRDLFAKLERDAALLDEEVTADRAFNFVVTGYSMIDYGKDTSEGNSGLAVKFVVPSSTLVSLTKDIGDS
jgi:hypothetical protein